MTLVTDPDNLDRYSVLIDPTWKTISLRGSGDQRAFSSTGSGLGGFTFNDASNGDFITDSVASGDILAICSDPDAQGGVIGHYQIYDRTATSLTLDRSTTQTGGSGVSYIIYSTGVRDVSGRESLTDGVTMQCLYSFLKEEWRTHSLTDGVNTSGEDLIKYTFPMVSITSEQFEIGGVSNSNWEFADNSGDGDGADESPRNLIRTGGWASINDSGVIINNYPGIITLGTLESDSQVYYQLTSATTTPTDFVLTGPVNQSIETLAVAGGASVDGDKTPLNQIQANIEFTAGGRIISQNDVEWGSFGFASGELVQVRNAEDSANNGLFTIESSGAINGVDTFLDTNATFTANADDDTALISPVTDNRDYLVLRVRTKAKSYSDSEIADIGVSQLNTIVNRFPLAEADDPAIVLDDGAINGDGTTDNVAFQSVTQVNTGTEGTLVDNGDGTFDLSNTTDPLWASTNQLYPGDTVEITGPTANNNIGVYEVSSVEDTDTVVLIAEPGRTVDVADDAGSVAWTARTRVRQDNENGTLTDSGGEVASDGTITLNDTGAFSSAVVGDIVIIETATPEIQGFYRVSEVTDNDNIKLDVKVTNSDDADAPYDSVPLGDVNPFTGLSGEAVTYSLLQAGMHLAYKKITCASVTPTGESGSTINGTDFTKANGYYVGAYVTLTGATTGNGTYLVTAVNSGTSITVANISDPSSGPTITGASSGTVTGSVGFVRKIGAYEYSFNWKLYGNNGDLGECFQFLQKQLRQTDDIDEGDDDVNGTFRGDITDLLMTFASPNGTTLNLFIDSLNSAESNNITLQDQSGANQTNPFIVALRIAVNNNILNANTNKIVVFFTDNDGTGGNGDEFGSAGAVIVQKGQGATGGDMVETDFRTALGDSSPITFEYDYDENDPGATNKGVTIVCITDDTGQYVQTTATLTKSNTVDASLVAGLERNYSNP